MDPTASYLMVVFQTPATSSAALIAITHWHLIKITVDTRYYCCLTVPLCQSGAI